MTVIHHRRLKERKEKRSVPALGTGRGESRKLGTWMGIGGGVNAGIFYAWNSVINNRNLWWLNKRILFVWSILLFSPLNSHRGPHPGRSVCQGLWELSACPPSSSQQEADRAFTLAITASLGVAKSTQQRGIVRQNHTFFPFPVQWVPWWASCKECPSILPKEKRISRIKYVINEYIKN